MINNINVTTFQHSKYINPKRKNLKNKNISALYKNNIFQNSNFGYISKECIDIVNELDEIRAEMRSGNKFEGDVKSLAKKLGL